MQGVNTQIYSIQEAHFQCYIYLYMYVTVVKLILQINPCDLLHLLSANRYHTVSL